MSRQLAAVLEKSGALTTDQVRDLGARASEQNRPLLDVVLDSGLVPEETLCESIATHLRVPFIRLAASNLDSTVVKLIPEELARKLSVIAVRRDEEKTRTGAVRSRLVVAMADPSEFDAVQQIEFASGSVVKPALASKAEISDAITRHYSPDSWLNEFLSSVDEHDAVQIVGAGDDVDLAEFGKDGKRNGDEKAAPAVKLVNLVLQQGIRERASDLHIEPTLNHLQVRARVQGMLKELMHVPKWLHEPLVSRLKILARLDITERRVPQDGRIKVTYSDRDVDLRVSTLPTHFGEKVVLRILGSGQAVPATSTLGFSTEELEHLKRASEQPQGLILVTGPTGSGKTTTLYSVINEKKSPSINIITVEDPIEFQLPGISQVQVNTKAGLTFAATLKSILRQDPDVILVGEIRDLETAEIAFHAAMTGHLVLSTLHTNGTVATIARLLELGVDPYLIGSTINVIVAQRLLRRLCSACKRPRQASAKTLERLKVDHLDFQAYESSGCDQCDGTGYMGRVGVYEVLRITPALKELINRKAGEPELRKAAVQGGTIMLLDAAMAKARKGDVSLDEILRVIQLEEEDVRRCPGCRAYIDQKFAVCPYCLVALKSVCESCRQELKPEWRICPYCRAAVAAPASEPQAVRSDSSAAAAPAPAVAAAPEPSAPAEVPETENPTILVIDDDDMLRSLIATSLATLPSKPKVLEASGGKQGLDEALKSKPDAILLDVNMPDMDGMEVCRRLRQEVATAFTPVLMLTVNADEQTRTKAFLIGTDDYMSKPFSVPELHARVSRLLRRTYGF